MSGVGRCRAAAVVAWAVALVAAPVALASHGDPVDHAVDTIKRNSPQVDLRFGATCPCWVSAYVDVGEDGETVRFEVSAYGGSRNEVVATGFTIAKETDASSGGLSHLEGWREGDCTGQLTTHADVEAEVYGRWGKRILHVTDEDVEDCPH